MSSVHALLLSTVLAWPFLNGASSKAALAEPPGHPKVVGSATRSDSIDLLHTHLDLDLTNTANGIITGHATITLVPKVAALSTVPFDLQLSVDSITMGDDHLAFADLGEEIRVDLGAAHGPADTLTLIIHYHGDPVTDPSGFGGFYTLSNYQYDLGVAFDAQPHSFGRSWFPCFDNFVERCTFDYSVRTNNGRSVVANGTLTGITDLGSGERITDWSIAEPIPAYLASVAAGNYVTMHDTFPSVAGTDVPVALVALPGDTADMKSSFIHLRNAFNTYEQWFGPYRWERVGYVLTSAGAMEHPTNICYPDFAADGTLGDERLMAHELSHHWFGDLITCQRPEEMYINEGFADFCSYLFLEQLYGEPSYNNAVRTNHHDMVSTAQLQDNGWYALSDVPAAYTYGVHSYSKGADVVRTLRGYLGDTLFSHGFKRVLANDAYMNMSSTQLRDSLSAATGTDLTDFFNDWIFQPGWAAFEVDSFTVAPAGDDFTVDVFIQQKTRGPAALYHHVPTTVTCLDATGGMFSSTVDLDGEFPIAHITCPFTPVTVRLNDDERLALATTAEQRTIPDVGPETLTLANFQFIVNTLPQPIPVRVEEFWVAADDNTDEAFAYAVSPDRWWRLEGTFPTGTSTGARFSIDGRATSSTAFDTGLIQANGGTAFNEDSLVLLFRTNPHEPWAPLEGVTINTFSSNSDGYARLDAASIQPGDFAVGWRKSATGVHEVSSSNTGWRYYPDPADDTVTIRPPEGVSASGSTLLVHDANGKLLLERPLGGGTSSISVARLHPQTVLLSVRMKDHGVLPLGPLIIAR